MKVVKSFLGFAAVASLVLMASAARAEFGTLAQDRLDREIMDPAGLSTPTDVPQAVPWEQNQATGGTDVPQALPWDWAPGSIAQESLDREISSPAVPTGVSGSALPELEDRAPGSIAQEMLDRNNGGGE